MRGPYTVVGVFPQEFADDALMFRAQSVYVEHVVAENADDAALEAVAMYEDREESVVVAVFQGHLFDVCTADEEYGWSCPHCAREYDDVPNECECGTRPLAGATV